uniref:Uncharacterized protein n=1 Tax=Oryza sativa subsp. japonica TaxID=39947 RepID=Q6K4P4_ORYSJ|nr:hypothetical protein [Oryza sativa Japonica Group]
MTPLPANHLPHHVGTPTNFHVSPRLRQGPPAMAQPVHWLAREAADDDRMGIGETAAARASRGGVGHHYIPSFYMPISDHSRKADQTAYYRRPCILVKQPNNWAGAGHGSGRSGGERGVKDDGAAELPSLFPGGQRVQRRPARQGGKGGGPITSDGWHCGGYSGQGRKGGSTMPPLLTVKELNVAQLGAGVRQATCDVATWEKGPHDVGGLGGRGGRLGGHGAPAFSRAASSLFLPAERRRPDQARGKAVLHALPLLPHRAVFGRFSRHGARLTAGGVVAERRDGWSGGAAADRGVSGGAGGAPAAAGHGRRRWPGEEVAGERGSSTPSAAPPAMGLDITSPGRLRV